MSNILDAIRPFCALIDPVGSSVTCNPPPMDTDADYLCLVIPGSKNAFIELMEEYGCELGGSLSVSDTQLNREGGGFTSYRLGEVNLIATTSDVFHMRFRAASSIAKRLNIMDKSDRIALFQAVLYGNF